MEVYIVALEDKLQMKPHKWAREIKAWADGAEIEYKKIGTDKWYQEKEDFPYWDSIAFEYRIKPQPTKEEIEKELARQFAEKALAIPEISEAVDRLFEAFAEKEPQYLYVYKVNGKFEIGYAPHAGLNMWHTEIIGKIKLETDDE